MPLPILNLPPEQRPADFLRLFRRTELHWTQSLADEVQLDCGTAFSNPRLRNIAAANRVLDAAVPEGGSPSGVVSVVTKHFEAQRACCLEWILNPSVAEPSEASLSGHLIERGWAPCTREVLRLAAPPRQRLSEMEGVSIIPARAGFRHATSLARELSSEIGEPQLTEATLLHLDDPHWDALLALRDTQAVGCIGVLSAGDIGRVDGWYISPEFRNRGIGRELLGRALEICARSVFRHVLAAVEPSQSIARAGLLEMGFEPIGLITAYQRPA